MNVYEEKRKIDRLGCILQMIIDFKKKKEVIFSNMKMIQNDFFNLRQRYNHDIEIIDMAINRLVKKYQSELTSAQ